MTANFDLFYRQHHGAVLRYVSRRCDNSALAEDIVAESFCQVFRLSQRSPDQQIGIGLVMTVARRRLIDHWRRSERVDYFDGFDRLVAAVDHQNDGLGEDVLAVLRHLPGRQRQALGVRYLLDGSVADVALQLECTYKSAESLLARGRRSFIRQYVEHCVAV